MAKPQKSTQMPQDLKKWRIAMQRCLLTVEEIEDSGNAAAIPEPVIIQIENLVRDLSIMRGKGRSN